MCAEVSFAFRFVNQPVVWLQVAERPTQSDLSKKGKRETRPLLDTLKSLPSGTAGSKGKHDVIRTEFFHLGFSAWLPACTGVIP